MSTRTRLSCAKLPDWHELLAAFCGHIGDQPGTHPITRCAFALAELHLALLEHPEHAAVIDCTRAELAADIDEWVTLHLPRTRHRRHRESFGAVVDRMAAAQVHANHVLRTAASAGEERVHTAWYQLAALADQWTDHVNMAGLRVS